MVVLIGDINNDSKPDFQWYDHKDGSHAGGVYFELSSEKGYKKLFIRD